jgi:biopolymer transport protein ExbB
MVLMALCLPAVASARWDEAWKQRTTVTLNTSATGVAIQETLSGAVIPVRLHSGNFDFVNVRPDGADLRVIGADDKTPLKFWIERFDGVNELAVLWVQLPTLVPNSDKNLIHVYAGNDKAGADANGAGTAASVTDASTLAVFHFAEKDGLAADQSGTVKLAAATPVEINGLIGQSARLSGAPLVWSANGKIQAPAGGPYSVSLWVRPEAANGRLFRQGPLQLSLAEGKLTATLGSSVVAAGEVAPAVWSQLAVVIADGKVLVYVNGAEAGQGAAASAGAPIAGDLQVGEGFHGLVDELQLASSARSAAWLKLNYAAQSADAKLVSARTEAEASESGGSTSYFGILFKSLTADAWVVIGILAVMFVIAVWVMVDKAQYIGRTSRANQGFLERFRAAPNVLQVAGEPDGSKFSDSSVGRIYQAGLRELQRRNVGTSEQRLSGASLDAVKAAIDADSVRESYALNARMVLLTIAISGGPFLGLLGTVIGVMITFASIAAAGDVNVNAIAPGIAAALLATVAGLSVAIPALFGYNYLASRIKTISSDMQIFIDEFVTRVAESYGA